MIGLGTIVNVAAIIIGGIIGLGSSKFLKERYQETVMKALAFGIIVMALGSTLSQMLQVSLEDGSISTRGTIMMSISLALGALIGEIINLEHLFEKFGIWLREKSGSQNDSRFVNSFVTASLTVCVGAMAIIGSIQDGVNGDPSTLFAKALLDFVIILIMASASGKGAIFSAIPVGLWQGGLTGLARLVAPIMTTAALSNLSLVGNILILCVGVNIIWPKTIRVANLLPSLVIAVAAAFIAF